jgi:hypothetical protein
MKVFVSSTFVDLADHRKAVDDTLSRLSAQFRGMEYFGARPYEPKKVCFDEIARCEVFIGIYAHRYGWIPPGDISSITEQEFDEARRRGMPCYCYVVDPNHPWNPKAIEYPALDKVKRLHEKIGTLVRSHFTTPDNLAKLVSTDLVAALTGRDANRTPEELIRHLRTCLTHEIATSVGTKYIRDLYVDRRLDRALQLRLAQSDRVSTSLNQVRDLIGKLRKAEKALAKKLAATSVELTEFDAFAEPTRRQLRKFASLPPGDPQLNYPCHDLNDLLAAIRNHVSTLERLHGTLVGKLPSGVHELRLFSSALQSTTTATQEAVNSLRPVYLIVDRAGGGKTNLLCHLAETFSETMPTFFIAARSIPSATDEHLVRYLGSVYPTSPDPIADAVASVAVKGHCVVVIDGINEHPDPRSLNAALKAFVRRYYNQPVKFVVSCRDIYWRYFEDDWWRSHGAFVSRDALYQFTSVEYDRALRLYLGAFDIEAAPTGEAQRQLRHPLLLRFFCEAYRGTPAAPTRLGSVSQLRLLDLFDAYCERKFEQVRARLGLIDSDEIFQYVKMLALFMLHRRSRLISTEAVAQSARAQFGERSIRTPDSRYVQILDEDILIEERPLGDLNETVVSFVYDEFMEYIIARALWSDHVKGRADVVGSVVAKSEELLSVRSEFISVVGVILYLGEMLARISASYLLDYLAALRHRGHPQLVCELAVRIAATRPRDDVFELIADMYERGTRKARHVAWQALELMAGAHWNAATALLTDTTSQLSIPAERALRLIRKSADHLNADEQLEALHLVRRMSARELPRIRGMSAQDLGAAVNTARILYERNVSRWAAAASAAAKAAVDEIQRQKRV